MDPWNAPDSDGEGDESAQGQGLGPQTPPYNARMAAEKARDCVLALQQPPQGYDEDNNGSGSGAGAGVASGAGSGVGVGVGSVSVTEDRIRGRLQEAKALSVLAIAGDGSQVRYTHTINDIPTTIHQ